MKKMTVSSTRAMNLCTSCGVCKGICPKNCITFTREKGLYLPQIDESSCSHCGLCASVCPGLGHIYQPKETAKETITGEFLSCYNAWSKDSQIRHISASGGVVSTMIEVLLTAGLYDSVFCLDTYDYCEQLETKRYDLQTYSMDHENMKTPKSRYLPVSHEKAIRYIRSHRDERIIFVATSCALRGIVAAIQKLKLCREQYLLIGLFCDKIFNYNVISYFEDNFCEGTTLSELHFKNKESGGWPGNMKLYPRGREPFYQPKAERERVKAYFMPERCLYCVDKLNVEADISLGDNYTTIASSELGSNSVMVRTSRGADAWKAVSEYIEYVHIDVSHIQKAQYLEGRLNNLYFGDLKSVDSMGLNIGVPREYDVNEFGFTMKHWLQKLRVGEIYDVNPQALEKKQRQDQRKPNPLVSFARRAICHMKRRLKK